MTAAPRAEEEGGAKFTRVFISKEIVPKIEDGEMDALLEGSSASSGGAGGEGEHQSVCVSKEVAPRMEEGVRDLVDLPFQSPR